MLAQPRLAPHSRQVTIVLVQLPIPGLVHLAYPRAADGVVHQCAWCQRVLDRAGRFRIQAAQLLRDASHGCCSRCAPLLRPSRL